MECYPESAISVSGLEIDDVLEIWKKVKFEIVSNNVYHFDTFFCLWICFEIVSFSNVILYLWIWSDDDGFSISSCISSIFLRFIRQLNESDWNKFEI